MKLSVKDRLVLINQYLILEKLYEDEASHYQKHRKALEEGYALHYDWIVEGLYDEMSEEECREVLDILDMFSILKRSYDLHKDTIQLEERYVVFSGFDGNNETRQMSYTRYFVVDLDRFHELRGQGDDFNSHMPSLPRYRRMLREWLNSDNKYELSSKDTIRIAMA